MRICKHIIEHSDSGYWPGHVVVLFDSHWQGYSVALFVSSIYWIYERSARHMLWVLCRAALTLTNSFYHPLFGYTACIKYISSLQVVNTVSVCLTSSPRPNVILLFICVFATFISTVFVEERMILCLMKNNKIILLFPFSNQWIKKGRRSKVEASQSTLQNPIQARRRKA